MVAAMAAAAAVLALAAAMAAAMAAVVLVVLLTAPKLSEEAVAVAVIPEENDKLRVRFFDGDVLLSDEAEVDLGQLERDTFTPVQISFFSKAPRPPPAWKFYDGYTYGDDSPGPSGDYFYQKTKMMNTDVNKCKALCDQTKGCRGYHKSFGFCYFHDQNANQLCSSKKYVRDSKLLTYGDECNLKNGSVNTIEMWFDPAAEGGLGNDGLPPEYLMTDMSIKFDEECNE
ncbi:hypothetical protein CYMTET_20596 [Cymbomonas tetramitiformis]|uniref:Uncharacterized protein n=1 Tax=Cymbomonas tetramitiformis TaxID=36881 RepID=A0AAE0G3W5_9CHLO|nr:hypothetical protein CYMTET_20596 [Cymbomonas tetramitiformis]